MRILMRRMLRFLFASALLVPGLAAVTFDEWRLDKFTYEEQINPSISGEAADPDGDGKTNLLEFALNTDPKSPDFAASWTTGLDAGGHLKLSFTRRKNYSGLLYAPQVSGHLNSPWKSGPPDVENVQTSSIDADTELVSVRDFMTTTPAGWRFIRLLVATDADNDGLPDEWEIAVFGSIASQSGSDDFDLDSLSNLLEWQKGTDAKDYYNGALPTLTIVSGDHQEAPPDAWVPAPLVLEVRNGSGTLLHNAPVSFALEHGPGWIATQADGTAEAYLDLRTNAQGRVMIRFHSSFIGGTTTIVASASSAGQTVTMTFTETTITRAERPDSLGCVVLDGGDAQFIWTDDSDNETGFLVEASADRGGTWQQIGTAGADVQMLTVVGLNPAGMVFRIAALNIAGRSGNTLDQSYGSADDDEDGLNNQDEEDEGTGKDNPDSDDDDVLDGDDGAPLDSDLSPKRLPKLPFVVIDLTQAGFTTMDVPVEINDRGHLLGQRLDYSSSPSGQEFFWADGNWEFFPWYGLYFGGSTQGRLNNADSVLSPFTYGDQGGGPYYFRVWNPVISTRDLPVNLSGFGFVPFGQILLYCVGIADDGVVVGHASGHVDLDNPLIGKSIDGTLATPASDFGNTSNWWLESVWHSGTMTGEDRQPFGMNVRHDIVGMTAYSPGHGVNARPFAYVNGQFSDLPGATYARAAWLINDPKPENNLPGPTILGEWMWIKTPNGWVAREMPGVPEALNDRLEIVGDFLTPDGPRNYYRNAQWLDLGSRRLSGGAWKIAPVDLSHHMDINNHGLIAARASRREDPAHVEKPVLVAPIIVYDESLNTPTFAWNGEPIFLAQIQTVVDVFDNAVIHPNGTAWIQPHINAANVNPQMPQLVARVDAHDVHDAAHVQWKLRVAYTRGNGARRVRNQPQDVVNIPSRPNPDAVEGAGNAGPWTAPMLVGAEHSWRIVDAINAEAAARGFFGGVAQLYCWPEGDPEPRNPAYVFRIAGRNPDNARCRQWIETRPDAGATGSLWFAYAIAKSETSEYRFNGSLYHQFTANQVGAWGRWPIGSPTWNDDGGNTPGGYGVFQVTGTPLIANDTDDLPRQQIWNWQDNVDAGIAIIRNKKFTHDIVNGLPVGAVDWMARQRNANNANGTPLPAHTVGGVTFQEGTNRTMEDLCAIKLYNGGSRAPAGFVDPGNVPGFRLDPQGGGQYCFWRNASNEWALNRYNHPNDPGIQPFNYVERVIAEVEAE